MKPYSWRIFRIPFKVDEADVIRAPFGYAMLA